MVSYCGTDSTTGRYFSFISRNFDPEQGCAAHAFVSLESSLEMTSAMERAFKQGFSSVYDCDLTADEYLE
ncbi:Oidioi.mRNA.OKI2018_I69.PAR.g12237.t1.cds [Oikopleura dioica]|uniref:Oidioi.mRNA.OKI2018_I69.PAR.g12237.t1.cds n=1 Tax=Oikopleura dioica TaxID=34765 RepID=A0ABN7S4R1_OIKDI|nr:Oidioi.mRNA.OKI2018_I69.PAR.g12237.t1.cds [Oikopleura dioica]